MITRNAFFRSAGSLRLAFLFAVSCAGPRSIAQTNTLPIDGNVGLGTLSPDRKLTIVSSASLDGAKLSDGTRWLLFMPGTVGASAYNSIVATNDNALVFSGGTQGSGGFVIAPWSSAIGGLRMDNFGNIGIGIRNPITSGTGYNSSRRHLTISGLSESGVLQLTSTAADADAVTQGLIEWTDPQSTSQDKRIGYLAVRKDGATSNNRGSAMTFASRPDNGTIAIERMRISQDGSLGIGTTAPVARLNVVGGYAAIDNYTHVLAKIGSAGALDFGSINGNAAYIGSTAGSVVGIRFYTNGSMDSVVMQLTNSGSVGIGTTNPGTYKLAVKGSIHAQEVVVDTSDWSDYVFAPDYRLAPLSEVERHIKTEGHLPGLPSANEIAEHGVTLGEMQAKLLAKIEELTLHQIELEKRQHEQADKLAVQAMEIDRLRAENISHREQISP